MHKLNPGEYTIRSRGQYFELKLTEPAYILDHEPGPPCNQRDGWRSTNNPAGDWSIDINGELKTLSTDGPFRYRKYRLRAL